MLEKTVWRKPKIFEAGIETGTEEPHNALLFSNLGLVQRKLGRYNDAVESYTYALNIAPLAVPILLNRAAIYLEQGMQDKAYVDYCQVMDVDKKNTEALLMRAYIYMLRRDYKGARLDYQRLLEIDPKNYNGRLGLATLEQKEGKFRESLDLLNQLLVEFPEDAVLYVARADVERDMKHEDLALVDLDEAIRLAPNSVDAYLLRGYLSGPEKEVAGEGRFQLFRWECPLPMFTNRCNNANNFGK